jgi:hypothetical protein
MNNKLYTEEQIRQNLNNMGYFVDEQIEDFINNLKPIEIPSVEKQQQGYTKDDIIKAYWERTDDIDVDGYWIDDPEKDIQNLIKHL